MATTGAEIARPANATWRLRMDVSSPQERISAIRIEAVIIPQCISLVSNRAMAGIPGAVDGDGEIAASRPARIGHARTAMQLLQSNRKVGQANLPARQGRGQFTGAKCGHLVQVFAPVIIREHIGDARPGSYR